MVGLVPIQIGEVNVEIYRFGTGTNPTSSISSNLQFVESSLTSEVYQLPSGDFEITWDISAKLDGWMEIILIGRPSSTVSMMEGAIHEFSIRVNNKPPVIKISGLIMQ